MAAPPSQRALGVVNLHKITWGCVGPAALADQRPAGLAGHCSTRLCGALPFAQSWARPVVSCSCRVREGSGINGHTFVSTRAESARGTPSDVWSKGAVRHPTQAAVRPALWDTRTGSADVTGEARHTYGRAPVPGVALRRQEGCAQRFLFRVLSYARSHPLPTLGPRPCPPRLSACSAAAQEGQERLLRLSGGSEPLAAAPGPGGEAEHPPPPREDAAPRPGVRR